MSKSVDLLNCLSIDQPTDHIVGWRGKVAISYQEFLIRAHAWQTLLSVTPGQNFALYIADSIEFAAALLGAWHAAKTVYLPADTLPGTCAALEDRVDRFVGEFGSQWHPVVLGADRDPADMSPFQPLSSDFVGLVVHTSGSTGAAQAVPKFLRQLTAEVETLDRLFGGMASSSEIVATVSHQHIYGLLFKVLWPLAARRPIHAFSCAYPEELAAMMTGRHCVLISSPAHLKRLPELSAWGQAAAGLHAIFSSGGPLPADVAYEAQRLLGQPPIEVYGSSETGGIAWRQRHRQDDDGWTPLTNVEWRRANDGVLEVRSPHLSDDGWFRLGDRVLPADRNRFMLQGRVDRIVKIEEKRISLDAIESQLLASPLVREARVLVVDGNRQRIAAFVVLSPEGCNLLAKKGKLAVNRLLREWLSRSVERVALPRLWRYPDALPVNAQGKITHADLMALLDEKPGPTMPLEKLMEQEPHRAVFELTAPLNLFYFDGHFPGAPILPGVVQIDWVIAFGRRCFDLPPVFIGMQALKFQQVIPPGLPVTLELIHEQAKSCLTFKLSSLAGQHGSGRILFGAADV